MRRNAIVGVLAGALLLMLAGGAALAATETGTRGDDMLVGTEGRLAAGPVAEPLATPN